MRYRIDSEPPSDFVPYKLTLTVETREEAILVHDKIACVIATSSDFIGDVFRTYAYSNNRVHAEGIVPLKQEEESSS